MFRSAALATALVLFYALPATAESESDYARNGLYIGLGGSYAIYTELEDSTEDALFALGYVLTVDIENPVGLNARVGYRASPHFAVEGQFEWLSKADVAIAGVDLLTVDSWILTANSKYYPLTDRVQPFILAGLGVAQFHVEDKFGFGIEDRLTGFAFRVGGGVDFYATRNLVLAVDVSYVLGTGDINDIDFVSFGWGLQYRF